MLCTFSCSIQCVVKLFNLQRKYRIAAEATAVKMVKMMAILCLARNDASTVSLCLFRARLLFPLKI